jgi:GNAT superfamily N-acetyltransferase
LRGEAGSIHEEAKPEVVVSNLSAKKVKPMITVEIKPIAEEEIAVLEGYLPDRADPAKYRHHFEQQRRGESISLIAWQDRFPIGRILLQWAGIVDGPAASRLETCPYIGDLFVMENYRSSGVGSQLLAVAEGLALQRGYQRTGLYVRIDDLRARSLYGHRGYRDAGLGIYHAEGQYLDEHNQEHSWQADVIYMAKLLL